MVRIQVTGQILVVRLRRSGFQVVDFVDTRVGRVYTLTAADVSDEDARQFVAFTAAELRRALPGFASANQVRPTLEA